MFVTSTSLFKKNTTFKAKIYTHSDDLFVLDIHSLAQEDGVYHGQTELKFICDNPETFKLLIQEIEKSISKYKEV
jgi:hypothetical protein